MKFVDTNTTRLDDIVMILSSSFSKEINPNETHKSHGANINDGAKGKFPMTQFFASHQRFTKTKPYLLQMILFSKNICLEFFSLFFTQFSRYLIFRFFRDIFWRYTQLCIQSNIRAVHMFGNFPLRWYTIF